MCCRFSGLWYTEAVPVILQRGNEVRPLVGRFSNMREPLSIDMLKSGRVKFKTDPISFC